MKKPAMRMMLMMMVVGLGLTVLTLISLPAKEYRYTTNNGAITITKYNGSGGEVEIPSKIKGMPVTSIGDQTFRSYAKLTSITIPNSVTSIGHMAFADCSNLTGITVNAQNSLYSSLAGVLFDKNQTTLLQYPGGKVGNYTIPNSITNIGVNPFWGSPAFWNCNKLTGITVDAQNPVFSSRDGVLFNKSQTTLIQCPGGKAGAYTIPASVTNIGNGAFSCSGLTSIIIPNTVTSIGHMAFIMCKSLTSIMIPNTVTSIGTGAFGDCDNLTSIIIPNSVTIIMAGTFSGCKSLTSVTIPNSVTNIWDWGFAYCASLTGVYFKGDAPSLGGGRVFKDSNKATIYYLPGTTGWGKTFGGRPTAVCKGVSP